MRAFAAILPPGNIREAFNKLQKGAPPKWIAHRPDEFHMTIGFLPDMSEQDVRRFGKAFREAVAERHVEKFSMNFEGLGAFPANGDGLINVHARPDKKSSILCGILHNCLQDALEECSFDGEPMAKRYQAHMTIFRAPAREEQAVQRFIEENQDRADGTFPVGSVVIMAKNGKGKTSGEGRFTIVAEIPLTKDKHGKHHRNDPVVHGPAHRGYTGWDPLGPSP